MKDECQPAEQRQPAGDAKRCERIANAVASGASRVTDTSLANSGSISAAGKNGVQPQQSAPLLAGKGKGWG